MARQPGSSSPQVMHPSLSTVKKMALNATGSTNLTQSGDCQLRQIGFRGVRATQSAINSTVMITARASEVFSFARIVRAGRDEEHALRGFQRPLYPSHIRNIRNYLRKPDAALPSSIVVGFVDGVAIREVCDELVEVSIDTSGDPRGVIIDGQQRLTALAGLPRKDFEIFVSVLVCRDLKELRRQFVMINNTRPLPKRLVYELLPATSGVQNRFASPTFAATLIERLNFDPTSSLYGLIRQHTNPHGVIRDTAFENVILHSLSGGVIRRLPVERRFSAAFWLLSEFFGAVRLVFEEAWVGHTPKSSRLLHETGVQALGFVMEQLIDCKGARTQAEFAEGLLALEDKAAWTSGCWRFSKTDEVPWNRLESNRDHVLALAQYLVTIVRGNSRTELKLEPPPSYYESFADHLSL
jgi:DGQHR domain-containing protein